MRGFAFALIAAAAAAALHASTGDPASAAGKPPAPPAAVADWRADPVCRTVFHAVLEGLYEDGDQAAAVDAVVPRGPKAGADPLRQSFVTRCPLCHPVSEAFAAYQRRPAFGGAAAPAGCGPGLDAAVVTRLTADDKRKRLETLARLVERWVGRRLDGMRLTAAERADWADKLGERSRQGRATLLALSETDPDDQGWSVYCGLRGVQRVGGRRAARDGREVVGGAATGVAARLGRDAARGSLLPWATVTLQLVQRANVPRKVRA